MVIEFSKVKEELTESYKRNSENAREIIHLNGEIKALSEQLQAHERELFDMKTHMGEGEMTIHHLETEIKDREVTISVLHAELHSLQLEYIRSEENLKKIQKENTVLVDRWLRKMSEEAEHMNEATKLFSDLKEKQAQLDALSRSSQPPVVLSPSQSATFPKQTSLFGSITSIFTKPPSMLDATQYFYLIF
jgi:chromosome segregation ATPase